MKIVRLQVENIKRIKAADITPNDYIVKITGKNEAGKSSVIDSIFYALKGKRGLPSQPVREGAKKGKIRLELDDYIITRIINPDRSSTLKVEAKDGMRFKNPQALLDKFISDLTFDPLEFANADSKTQTAILLKASKIDFSVNKLKELVNDSDFTPKSENILDAFNEAIDFLKQERRLVNKDRRRLQATLESYKDVEEIDVVNPQDIIDELQQVEDKIRKIDEIDSLTKEIKELENRLKQLKRRRKELANIVGNVDRNELVARKTELKDKLKQVTDQNAVASRYQEKVALLKQLAEVEERYNDLDERIDKIIDYRAECLAKAKLPLAKLSIGEDGEILYDGVPFAQRGTSKKILISAAIGAALNPTLRIMLIKNGNDLDSDHMELLAKWAAKHDFQIWVERVADTPDGISFFIEDGELKT